MFYFLLELIIIVYGILLAVKPDFWWKMTNKNPNQTPPHSYIRNTRVMGIVFVVLGAILLLLSLICEFQSDKREKKKKALPV